MDKLQARHYEELFKRLLSRGEKLHDSNKKRIRAGLIFLAVFTVAMIFIRWLTDSDRAAFMMIWILGMFVSCIYLVSVEYIDDSIRKTLEDVTERDTEFDDLIMNSGEVQELLHERREQRHEDRAERREQRHEDIQERHEQRHEDRAERMEAIRERREQRHEDMAERIEAIRERREQRHEDMAERIEAVHERLHERREDVHEHLHELGGHAMLREVHTDYGNISEEQKNFYREFEEKLNGLQSEDDEEPLIFPGSDREDEE